MSLISFPFPIRCDRWFKPFWVHDGHNEAATSRKGCARHQSKLCGRCPGTSWNDGNNEAPISAKECVLYESKAAPMLIKYEDFLFLRYRDLPEPTAKVQIIRKIHILYANVGNDHNLFAVSLEAAFRQHFHDKVDVKSIDFMQGSCWPLNDASWYQSLLDSSLHKYVTHTSLFQWSWGRTRDRVCEFVNNSHADLFISVHPLIHHYILKALETLQRSIRIVTVVTDLASAHPSWFSPNVDLLFVPTDQLAKLAQKLGIEKAKINTCGPPLRECFWHPKSFSKTDARVKLNLQVERGMAVVLVMGVGEGLGDLLGVARSLESQLTERRLGKMVVICGRNSDVKCQLEQHMWLAKKLCRKNFMPEILGIVSNVHEYMCASDCLVTRAGARVIAEGMSMGLPCLLTFSVPENDHANPSFVEENWTGIYVSHRMPDTVAEVVVKWLEHPDSLKTLSDNARSLIHPRAALDIAKTIGSELLKLA